MLRFSSVQFGYSVISKSLQPHGLQHARLLCLSSTPGNYSKSCPSSWWWHPTFSSSVVPFSFCLLLLHPSIRVFSNESVLHIRWPKYWSFSIKISPSNEYSGLISFRIDWLDLLAFQSLKMKRTSFLVSVPEGIVGIHRTVQFQPLLHQWLGHWLRLLSY